jgi:hypothetical protein
MQRHLKNPRTKAGGRANAGFDAAGVEQPSWPSGIFARLGVLLVIALGFGLAAQLLVGAPH